MADPIRVGLAGIGRAGWGMHCGELAKFEGKFEIVAACDIEQERIDMMAEKYGCATYTDFGEMLKDPNVELVSIATRSPEHTPHAILALEAGKYVFLEKPIALTYAQALELKAVSDKHPGKLFLRHNRRFEPCFNHILEIIASGKIGEPYEFKLRRHGYQRRNDWQTIIECGGGQLNNWGPHIVDHALQFLASPVKDIWSDLKKIAAVGDAEDHLKVVLRGENGRIVDLEISGGVALGEPVYHIAGTRGAIRSVNEKTIEIKYLDPEQELADIEADPVSPPIKASFGNAEKLQWIEETVDTAPSDGLNTGSIYGELYATLREGKPYRITLEEGLEVVRVTDVVKSNSDFAV
jgi:predicted dehydrogenase